MSAARYTPMASTLVREPFHRDGWVYEEKVDGSSRTRTVHESGSSAAPASTTRSGFATSRQRSRCCRRRRRARRRARHLRRAARSRFDWLRRGAEADALATLAAFIAFDVLNRVGKDETDRPLWDRRVLLEDVLASTSSLVLPVRRLAPNGFDAWAQVLASGYEGYVAKDILSPYRGGVTRSWLRVKVPGWTDPEERWKRVRLDDEETARG